VWQGGAGDAAARTAALLAELGRRRLTNLLVEGGPTLLAGMFVADQIDEVWAFVAPRILGGGAAGPPALADVPRLAVEDVSFPGGDVLIRGTIARPPMPPRAATHRISDCAG
jgi:diaminohydroxyphosphoribosylaminopyrimidine deaminase/5-amino-6-(5-phosphoribosylamino)uracil reductase